MTTVIATLIVSLLLEDAHVIPDIEPMQGPDPTLSAVARSIRAASDPSVSDAYLFGVSGVAFLATVCSNNCNCREYRELFLRLDPTLMALGVEFEKLDNATDEASWAKVKASIDDNVPVLIFNLFGDWEDAVLTGYDMGKDLAYGWGAAPAGKEYASTKLSAWRQQGITAYIVHRGKPAEIDRKAIELASLREVIACERRPPICGG